MDMRKCEFLEQVLCKELEELEAKYRGGQKMAASELDMLDKIFHTLKSMEAYKAMKGYDDYEYEEGMSSEGGGGGGGNSGYRGRSPMTGRYISREGGSGQSYARGYSAGYSEAMNSMSQASNGGGNSGHYPTMPPYYRNNW